jgi:4-hydroxybenzoate polyprenyltransferase
MSRDPRDLLRALRPAQWSKNAVVLAAFLFALGDTRQQVPLSAVGAALAAAVLFCMASSAVYLVNDLHDRDADRRHPTKRLRPIAAGRVAQRTALTAAAGLAAVALAGALVLSPPFAGVMAGYFLLQAAYTFLLKDLPMLDVVVIAAGFVLRAVAGAAAIPVTVSPWLLVCTFLLALFLALCKRRQELMRPPAASEAPPTRRSLRYYDARRLDQWIAAAAACTLTCYAIYTVAPDTVAKFGNARLLATLPFVVFGLLRYLHLVYRRDLGETPERILLTDAPTLANVALYGLAVAWLLAR